MLTGTLTFYVYRSPMEDKPKIIEVSRLAGNVLVVFSDGRVATLAADSIYAVSVEPPPDLDLQ
jgi:hypothetical protein